MWSAAALGAIGGSSAPSAAASSGGGGGGAAAAASSSSRVAFADDSLYAGFNDGGVAPMDGAYVLPVTSMGRVVGGAGPGGLAGTGVPASRWGVPPPQTGAAFAAAAAAGGAGAARPMTSVRAAGFISQPRGQTAIGGVAAAAAAAAASMAPRSIFDPMNVGSVGGARGPAPALQERADNSPEDRARDMERKITAMTEEAVTLSIKGQTEKALEVAKEACKKERLLFRHREQHQLTEFVNIDLTYSVLLTLATMYERCSLHQEALSTYSLLVKNKDYAQAGRLRVNMGNIYYRMNNFPSAIKMYRMALDQVANLYRAVRFRIMCNIGNAFVKLGMFAEAIESYSVSMDGHADLRTGFNLLLCCYALGDGERMKSAFAQLLSVPQYYAMEDGDGLEDEESPAAYAGRDVLRKRLVERKHRAVRVISTAARLIAPRIAPTIEEGYDFLINMLRASPFSETALEMENQKAIAFFDMRDFQRATETLKSFVHVDGALVARAATNLSFVRFLENDFKQARDYAEKAVAVERYNAAALVNFGNALFATKSFQAAEDKYQEALNAEADCTEALYNLGLAQRNLNKLEDALQTFHKLRVIVPRSADVLYHIADIYEQKQEYEQAVTWFSELHLRVPTDPGVLKRLGVVCQLAGDEAQAFQHFSEAHTLYPVDIEVIEWLASYYVTRDAFEKALPLLEQAARVRTREPKWLLMAASCVRRLGAYQQALKRYERVLEAFPDNIECLRFLVQLCNELGFVDKTNTYAEQLQRAERKLEAQLLQQQGGQQLQAPPQLQQGQGPAQGGSRPSTVPSAEQQQMAREPSPQQIVTLSEEEVAARARGMMGNAAQHGAKRTIQARAGREDDDWGDGELGEDLLPM